MTTLPCRSPPRHSHRLRLIATVLVLVPLCSLQTSQASSLPGAMTESISVRVVSYNVLCSHLADPDRFTHCDPQLLAASTRLTNVLSQLDEEIASSVRDTPAIFCLQEVSHDWAGSLHTFFANRGYHLVTGLYGKKYNNYMGVALAYPTSRYETIHTDISRLADKRVNGWPRQARQDTNVIQNVVKALNLAVRRGLQHLVRPTRKLLQLPDRKSPIDHWQMSENRFNILLTATLRDKACAQRRAFCVSNYHMPCAFYAPMVMNIHAEMAARRVQDLAMANGDLPYVLAGDFNIMPDSPHYELLTKGVLNSADPTYPAAKFGMVWHSTIRGMRSAYGESEGGEPNFTNYAQIHDDDPFIGTLDYIFISDSWKVTSVKKLPHRDSANGPYPNQNEPSDHLLIAANLQL